MFHRAKNPDRVVDKIYECRFFLSLMTSYDEAQDAEKFRYCLNAFLCAFRTIDDRLFGVTEARDGKAISRALQRQRRSHPEIALLFDQTNMEVHADGPAVNPRYAVRVSFSVSDRWKSKWDPDASKWQSRFKSRYGPGVLVRRVAGWQFAGNPRDLMELCKDALKAIEGFVVPAITATPSPTQPAQPTPGRSA